MSTTIAIVIILVLVFYFATRTEYLSKHLTIAYLIHEATSDQCVECREIRNYFYSALGNQRDMDLYSYHLYEDHQKIQDLEDKYKFKAERTPVLLVVHDDGKHQIFRGYPAVHQAITMLRYHPSMERRVGW